MKGKEGGEDQASWLLVEQPGVGSTMCVLTSSSRKCPDSSCAVAKFMGYSDVQVFWFLKEGSACKTLDVDARYIWMWFALFLNNRQF